MGEITRIGGNVQNSGSSGSGAEQLMDLLRDPHVGKEELPLKLKETLTNLPEPEAKALQNRIKNNDKNDPLAQLIRESVNKADVNDIVNFDSNIPSVPLGGKNRKQVGKDSDIPSVPLGGGKVHGKEPDIKPVPLGGGNKNRVNDSDQKLDLPPVPLGGRNRKDIGKDSGYPSVPLGGGKVHGKEPDIPSVPLGGRNRTRLNEPADKIDISAIPLGGANRKDIEKEPEFPSVPLGGGRITDKDPEFPSVPLGGNQKLEKDSLGKRQQQRLQDLLLNSDDRKTKK